MKVSGARSRVVKRDGTLVALYCSNAIDTIRLRRTIMRNPGCQVVIVTIALILGPVWGCAHTQPVGAARAVGSVGSQQGPAASIQVDTSLFSAVIQAFLPTIRPSSTAGRVLLINPRPVRPSGLLGDLFADVDPRVVETNARIVEGLGIATILVPPEPACRRGGGRMLANPDSADVHGPMVYCVLVSVPRPFSPDGGAVASPANDQWVMRVYGISSEETAVYQVIAERNEAGTWRVVEQRLLQHYIV